MTSFVYAVVRALPRSQVGPGAPLHTPAPQDDGKLMDTCDYSGATPTGGLPDLGADYTLCECKLEQLQEQVATLEALHSIVVRKQPSICLTMIPAADSLEGQKFYLGEALVTECEVTVDGLPGYGLCMGDEPARAYCMAVIDALLHGGGPSSPQLEVFLAEQREIVARRDQDELNLILQTQVDFKLMEEE